MWRAVAAAAILRDMSPSVRSAAAEAGDHPILEHGARLGYAAGGVLHLMLAWVALQLTIGRSDADADADQTGALAQLGGTAVGRVLLGTVLAGFVLLALWQVTEAITRSGADRARPAAKAVVHVALAWTTLSVLRGAGSSGGDEPSGATARLLAQPFGAVLVGAVGLALLAVAAFHVDKGWRKRFLDDLREHPDRWVITAGRVGYVAKGVALAVVGALVTAAALTNDPEKAEGLDGALHSLLEVPLGRVLVALIATGLACYGAYALARARYARV